MSEVKEIRALTGLRGIAAVYVVIFHYSLGLGYATLPKTFLSHGYLAVDLFFVLSGFVMTLNYAELFRGGWQWRAFRIFLSRRIARVYPLFIVTAVYATILIGRGMMEGPQVGSKALLAWNVLMVQSWGMAPSFDAPSWSISAEWAAYLLFPTLFWLGRNPVGRRAKQALVSALFAVAVLCYLPQHIVHRPDQISLLDLHVSQGGWPVFRCLSEFFLGVYSARVYVYQKNLRFLQKASVGTAVGGIMLLLLALRGSDFFFVAFCPILLLCLTATPGLLVRLGSGKAVHHLGIISYSIYLVHDLLGGVVGFVHHYANSQGMQHGQTYGAVVALALVYPLSLLAYRWIEKPGRTVVRGLLERPKAPREPVGPLGLTENEPVADPKEANLKGTEQAVSRS